MPPLLALLPPRQSNLSCYRAWAPHHLRGLFCSITPHVAAAVIPPSAMSTKTSSGVPRVVIIFATLVVVLATSVEVVPHVGIGRCDDHHGFTLRVPHHFLDCRHDRDQDQLAQCRTEADFTRLSGTSRPRRDGRTPALITASVN